MNKTDFEDNDSILLFEYYTASGITDPGIISEAISMVNSLLDDLNDLNVCFLVSDKFKHIIKKHRNINSIIIYEDLEQWLSKNVANFNSCIFISSEENMKLYNLTNLIERKGVKLYGSTGLATSICSNKFTTFKKLKNIVKQPKTFKLILNNEINWEIMIKNLLEYMGSFSFSSDDNYIVENFKLLVKPVYGVDCQDVSILSSFSEINNLKNIYPEDSELIIQEFIPGDTVSVSLISDGEISIPISLNKQYIYIDKENHNYLGGEIPYDHSLKEKAFEVAKKAVESIGGIKGFVGVDLILNEDVYFLEINSRFTTSYVGLKRISNFNIGKTIIKLLDNEISIDLLENNLKFNNKVKFIKKDNILRIEQGFL